MWNIMGVDVQKSINLPHGCSLSSASALPENEGKVGISGEDVPDT